MMSANSSFSAASSCVGGQRVHAQHEIAVDEPQRVVVAVEGRDLFERDVRVVGDLHELEVVRRDVPAVAQLRLHELQPGGPVGATGHVEQHDRRGRRLAGLHERQQLERFVERAEAAGKEHERVRFLHERDLAREEVPEVDELRVVGEEL